LAEIDQLANRRS